MSSGDVSLGGTEVEPAPDYPFIRPRRRLPPERSMRNGQAEGCTWRRLSSGLSIAARPSSLALSLLLGEVSGADVAVRLRRSP